MLPVSCFNEVQKKSQTTTTTHNRRSEKDRLNLSVTSVTYDKSE